MPHRQMKCSVPKLLICDVIYLLHKCFSFFSTSQQATHSWFFFEKQANVMHYIASKNLFFNCMKEERARGGRGKRRISHTANFSDHSESSGNEGTEVSISVGSSDRLPSAIPWVITLPINSLVILSKIFLIYNHCFLNK